MGGGVPKPALDPQILGHPTLGEAYDAATTGEQLLSVHQTEGVGGTGRLDAGSLLTVDFAAAAA